MRVLEAELAEYRRGWPPGHFYSPIPALDEIRRREHELFGRSPAQLPGIDLRVDAQLELLTEIGELTADQPWSDEPSVDARYHFDNPNFRHGEALPLLGLLCRTRPVRVLEVGSGYSSAAILDVAEWFLEGVACTFVEPQPALLRSLLRPEDDVELLACPVQAVPLDRFERLADGDVLFIDSTHVAKTGSDVNYLVHEVLPRLAPGVLVHVHDIHHPFEYPREWVLEGRAWNEAYVVRAFLEFNAAFEVLLFPSYLAQHHRRELEAALPLTARGAGSSLWLRRRVRRRCAWVMTAPTRFATLVLDVGRPLPAVHLGGADFWAVVLTYDGRPIEHVWMPSPGAAEDPRDLLDALFGRAGARAAAEAQLRERLKARLGASAMPYPPRSCSVVVCTHGRPTLLGGLLACLARLDPAPNEVVIVDNAPGAADCRDLVHDAGFRYVREDRKGLDHARRAGLAAARGELVAFTDDDCLPARTWLAALPELFFDRGVGAVTGPGFASELATPAQVRFEEVDGFSRGLRTRAYDMFLLDPVFWDGSGQAPTWCSAATSCSGSTIPSRPSSTRARRRAPGAT